MQEKNIPIYINSIFDQQNESNKIARNSFNFVGTTVQKINKLLLTFFLLIPPPHHSQHIRIIEYVKAGDRQHVERGQDLHFHFDNSQSRLIPSVPAGFCGRQIHHPAPQQSEPVGLHKFPEHARQELVILKQIKNPVSARVFAELTPLYEVHIERVQL